MARSSACNSSTRVRQHGPFRLPLGTRSDSCWPEQADRFGEECRERSNASRSAMSPCRRIQPDGCSDATQIREPTGGLGLARTGVTTASMTGVVGVLPRLPDGPGHRIRLPCAGRHGRQPLAQLLLGQVLRGADARPHGFLIQRPLNGRLGRRDPCARRRLPNVRIRHRIRPLWSSVRGPQLSEVDHTPPRAGSTSTPPAPNARTSPSSSAAGRG